MLFLVRIKKRNKRFVYLFAKNYRVIFWQDGTMGIIKEILKPGTLKVKGSDEENEDEQTVSSEEFTSESVLFVRLANPVMTGFLFAVGFFIFAFLLFVVVVVLAGRAFFSVFG
jgi:hypothetical protein